ncbi:MAG: hypothetical protein IPH20_18310 [Bacteroidales bacterium]|nr:hypothetical protein [Bacteroidales bacterium]
MRQLFSLFLLLLLFQTAPGNLFAQNQETAAQSVPSPDTASVYAATLSNRWKGENLTRLADTSLKGFQFYIPTESESGLYLLNGNAGLAYKSMVFDPEPASGFRFAPSDFGNYLLRNDNINFYHIHGPYSHLFYSMGKEKEQIFNVTHAQNLSRGITLGVDLRIINSVGLYDRQKSDNSGVAIQGQFVSDNERLVTLANYHNNRLRWRENGGIKYDSLFSENIETDRTRIPINLEEADNQIKEYGVFLRQFYYFGRKPGQAKDTIHSDSLRIKPYADTIQRYYNPARTNYFSYTFSYSRNSNLYKDGNPKSGYYSEILIDSLNTYDSVYYHEIVNDISFEGGVGRTKGQEKALLLRAGIEYAISVYRNDSISKNFTRLTPYAWLSANAFGVARAEGKIWLTQGNPFNGDKGLSAKLSLPAADNSASWGNLIASVSLDALQPDYLYQFHYSNHFSWNNTFGQQTIFGSRAMYQRNNVKAGFNYYNLTNWVYFNQEAKPERNDGSFSVSQAWGQADFTLGKFNFEAFGVWQNVSKSAVLHLPEIAGRLTGSFSIPVFKRALHLHTGFSVLYNSAFFADAYMPALRSYYVQNSVSTGNYPYVDGFINIRVKRARMYLLAKHLNSGFSGYNYIMVPGYPMPDRGLKFGISWMFYD